MLSFVTPQHDPGSVDVVVTNGTGSTTTKFTYRDPAFVQASASNTQMNNSVAATYPNAQGNENLNIVVVGWGDFTSSVTKISDNLNGDYDLTLQVGPFQGPSTGPPLQQTIFYRPKINPGSGNVVTVQFNNGLTPATAPDIRILEYTGLDPSDPLDGTPAGANGTGTAADSGPAATSPTFRTGIILGAGTSQTTFSAAGFPPNRTPANANGNVTEDNVLSAAGNYNATAKNSSGNWLMQAAIFRAP
jgi:hypothetical protein